MKKLHILALVPITVFTAQIAMADPIDNGPPAQQQKNAVPNSTSNGNYLEDEQSPVVDEKTPQTLDKKSKEHQKKNSKPNSREKGKSHNETPEKGGVDVK